ncbi:MULTISPECIES: hypothetical protein [unclassified Micromonospora]|uniref:hypothetical protein n=1 Tax=unclassified Micromonospora TaxID=2617518 RepID=UPI00331974F4
MAKEYVLVRGVVYFRPRAGEGKWFRVSMPPDAAPGSRSTWPPTYTARQLPRHEPIGEERAGDVVTASFGLLDRIKATAQPTR